MITSKDNELIKLAMQIKEKKYSKKYSLCLVETFKIIKEVGNKGLLTNILVTEDKFNLVKEIKSVKIDIISKQIANLLSETSTSDGIFGICKVSKTMNSDFHKCIVLDNLQDPSNIGAIIRSARAFGFSTILSINSVYPYTYKCIRASMGYIFDVDYIETTYDELKTLKLTNNLSIITADMNGCSIDSFKKDLKNYAIIIGNEGKGISDEISKISDEIISIPMQNNVESLNASVSASILMYLLK